MHHLDFKRLIDVSAKRKRPLVIAHRGASSHAPENTLPAIERAMELGADGIEFDVLLTRDRVPILSHNDDLSILTHHHGYAHLTPFSMIKSLDVGSHFGASFAGTKIPTLAEALELISGHDIATIIEIKAQTGMTSGAAKLIGGIAKDIRLKGPVILTSSSIRVLKELRRSHPELPRGLILRRRAFSFLLSTLFANLCEISSLNPSLGALSGHLVKRMKRAGCMINAWTANEAEEFEYCLENDVDGIITDDVQNAIRYLDETVGRSE